MDVSTLWRISGVLKLDRAITCRFRPASARFRWFRVVFIAVVPLSALGGKQIQFLETDVSSVSVQP